MQERLAIVDGVRTPFGRSGVTIKEWKADDLGCFALKELLARVAIPLEQVDEVIFGCCNQPAESANVARVIALKAGLPLDCPAYTVHRNCASGMEAISTGCYKIMAGESEIIAVGGSDSMSNIPLLYGPKMVDFFSKLMRAKTLMQRLKIFAGFRPSFLKPVIALELGLTDPMCGMIMGKTAEVLARDFGINRDAQDAFAMESHHRACAAWKEGRLAEEVVPIPANPRFQGMMEKDDGPRENQSMAALAKLKTIFDRQAGTVTPGNACQITDGAAALMVMKESKAKELGLQPLGYMREHAYAALDGCRMGLGPVYATHKLLKKAGMQLSDFELFEINEAFATQVMGCQEAFASDSFCKEKLGADKALGEIPHDKLNVNGGAIALGHPVGATGARLVITLLKEMRRRNLQTGLATLCIGGGQGAAMALEVE